VHRERARRLECVALPELQQQAVQELRPVDPQVVRRLPAARPLALQLLAAQLPAVLASGYRYCQHAEYQK
jgi:hypothetical protein